MYRRPVHLIAALLGLSAGLGLPACERSEVPVATRKPAPARDSARKPDTAREAGPFVYARAQKTEAAVPARFTAGLPTRLADFRGDWSRFPPRALITAGLGAGDAGMQARFLAAIRKAAADGALDEKLSSAYTSLLGYSPGEAACGWLLAALGAEKDARVRGVLYGGLSRCRQPRFASAFERDDAPADAVLESVFSAFGRTPARWNPQLARVAREVVAKGKRHEIRKLSVVLGRYPGPEPLRLAAELQKEIQDPEQRALVAIGLGERKDEQAKALFEAACGHPKVKEDPLCQPRKADEEKAEPEKPDLAREVRGYDFDPAARIAAEPGLRGPIVSALAACLGDLKADEYSRAACLARLASLDRKRAAAELAKVEPGCFKSDRARQAAASLRRFGEPGALEARLHELGLLAKPEPVEAAGLAARDVLEAAGRVHSFDTETGQFPNEHDGLLSELAALAGEAMQGAVFEEIPPKNDRGPYVLRGYLHGKRWEVRAQNLGDWYDMHAVLGLLNAMLRDEKSEIRYVSLPTGDQTASVLAGPAGGILAAAGDGLIGLAGAADGMQAGKDFEERVLKALKAGGIEGVQNLRVKAD
ncbi:MAG: hypothetical protein JXR96_20625 [Deltaproteobacteria bacterium]|nr:hypothetical protein [Deltaproteobacteria bacterium]